ncbi:uroporphyrinogen-III synthase [Motiliproteus coralliicola]|uniref:Uroporphyrinogen-III synthase n=1 Tax=Motiliproteus coralliicola TaxID=2283196 RepID=A0A369WA43_9GAMM|nr:uroporphyrinogen-III synthase [Motiliproteus coralliicola]RDE18191.1 uroporphyrinogen-III synthase [Motiliproteus coralliicola]
MSQSRGSAGQAQPLAGQRILVTRPAHQADPLCRRLQQLGAEPIRFPLLKIAETDPSAPHYPLLKQQFLDLDNYQAVIFVSANAARLGYDWIDQYWPQLPIRIDWLAVGSATADCLSKLGIQPSSGDGRMDSETLLQLPQLQQVQGQRILICRGSGGRELLAETLRGRGAQVDLAELYRREIPEYDATEIESIIYKSSASAMLVSSGEALSNLINLTQPHGGGVGQLAETPLVVPSQRVAELAKQNKFNHIRVAANATDDAMIDVLMDLGATPGKMEQ